MLVFRGELLIQMTIFLVLLTILAILIFSIVIILIKKTNAEYKKKTALTIKETLEKHDFISDNFIILNKHQIFAINKQGNKFAYIENFNPDLKTNYDYIEISTNFISKIQKNKFNIKLDYIKKGEKHSIHIKSNKKEYLNFFYNLYKQAQINKINDKFSGYHFTLTSASNWECDYVWAYDTVKTAFAYFQKSENSSYGLINLRKEFFTIDTSYNYIELPIQRELKQINIYDKTFTQKLYNNILNSIRQRTSEIVKNKLFFDGYNKILYISNAVSSLQSVILDKTEEVFYSDNKISFTLNNSKKILSFSANRELIEKFQEFMTGYNLRKIANNFDYKSDKLINVNTNTKFIFDTTRDRMIYCANLNKLLSFSYLTISFNNTEKAIVEHGANKHYVRIYTKNKDIIDITCLKSEIAQYIKAQIDTITGVNLENY